MKTKKIITLAMLTALYVALSALMKIPFIGNISLDLGYIAFVVALMSFKYAGIAVGVLGCALESLLFSAYVLGILLVKTGIECRLYNIPTAIKVPKNLVACLVDTITMWLGIWIFNEKRLDKLRKVCYN